MTSSGSTNRIAGVGAKAGLVLAMCLLTLGSAEVVVRLFPGSVPRTELDIYRKDAEGNLLLRPSIERRHRTRHWDVAIRTGERGFRTSANSLPDGRLEAAASQAARADSDHATSILTLGDSFAFGWGVEFEEAFPSLVAQQVARNVSGRGLNTAVPGTGPSDQLRLLQQLFAGEKPAIVLMAFFVGNDFTDVGRGGADQFSVEDGLLFRHGLGEGNARPAETLTRSLVRRSRLAQALGPLGRQWFGSVDRSPSARLWDEWLREFSLVHFVHPPGRTRAAIEQTLAVLDETADYCRQRSSRLVLLILPRSYQVYERETAAMREALAVSPGQVELDRPQRILKAWAERTGVEAVDLLPSFRRHAAKHPDSPLFYFPDAHLTADGHALAADIVLPALSSTLSRTY